MGFRVLCRSSHTTHPGGSVQMVRCEDAAYSFHHLPQMTQCSILRRLTSYCAGPMPLLAQMNIPTALRHVCGERFRILQLQRVHVSACRVHNRHYLKFPAHRSVSFCSSNHFSKSR